MKEKTIKEKAELLKAKELEIYKVKEVKDLLRKLDALEADYKKKKENVEVEIKKVEDLEMIPHCSEGEYFRVEDSNYFANNFLESINTINNAICNGSTTS